MLRPSPDLHHELFVAAKRVGKSLYAWIAEQLERAVHVEFIRGTISVDELRLNMGGKTGSVKTRIYFRPDVE